MLVAIAFLATTGMQAQRDADVTSDETVTKTEKKVVVKEVVNDDGTVSKVRVNSDGSKVQRPKVKQKVSANTSPKTTKRVVRKTKKVQKSDDGDELVKEKMQKMETDKNYDAKKKSKPKIDN